MSLLTTNTSTVTIKRQTVTKTAAMGTARTYTTAARGSLPTSLSCRVMNASARERFAYGQQDQTTDVALLFTTNPQVDVRDRITFDGRELDVLTQINVQNLGRLWIVECFESSRGVK